MNNKKTVLCVEDHRDCAELLQYILEREEFQVTSCSTSEEGLQLAGQKKFSAIILDHRLAGISGTEICRRIRAYDRLTPIIFFSAAAFPTDREAGLEAGANEYLVKPQDLERISETIKRLT